MGVKKKILVDGDYIPVNEVEQYYQALDSAFQFLIDDMKKDTETKRQELEQRREELEKRQKDLKVYKAVMEKALSMPDDFWNDENAAASYLQNYKQEILNSAL